MDRAGRLAGEAHPGRRHVRPRLEAGHSSGKMNG